MKKLTTLFVCVLCAALLAVLAAGCTQADACAHTNLLRQYGQQVFTDGQYSVDVTTSCSDCGKVLYEDRVVSEEEIDMDELMNQMLAFR